MAYRCVVGLNYTPAGATEEIRRECGDIADDIPASSIDGLVAIGAIQDDSAPWPPELVTEAMVVATGGELELTEPEPEVVEPDAPDAAPADVDATPEPAVDADPAPVVDPTPEPVDPDPAPAWSHAADPDAEV